MSRERILPARLFPQSASRLGCTRIVDVLVGCDKRKRRHTGCGHGVPALALVTPYKDFLCNLIVMQSQAILSDAVCPCSIRLNPCLASATHSRCSRR